MKYLSCLLFPTEFESSCKRSVYYYNFVFLFFKSSVGKVTLLRPVHWLSKQLQHFRIYSPKQTELQQILGQLKQLSIWRARLSKLKGGQTILQLMIGEQVSDSACSLTSPSTPPPVTICFNLVTKTQFNLVTKTICFNLVIFMTECTATEMLRICGISSLMMRRAVPGWWFIAKSWLQYYLMRLALILLVLDRTTLAKNGRMCTVEQTNFRLLLAF